MKSKNLSVVDLFAGCGGLGLGLEQAGFTPVYVNELNDYARTTYLENRKAAFQKLMLEEFHSADIKALNSLRSLRKLSADLGEAHGIQAGDLGLVCGGPPCQGFSGIGHRRSYAVDRLSVPSNHLYQDMVDVIAALKPRAFLFENVRGLLTARWTPGGRRIWPDVLSAFRALEARGYLLAYQLVHAKDYRVPQNRPRVLLVGLHRDTPGARLVCKGPIDQAVDRGFLPPRIEGGFPHPAELLSDLVVDPHENGGVTEFYPRDAETDVQRVLRTPRSSKCPMPAGAAVTDHKYSMHSDRVRERFAILIKTRGKGPIPERLLTRKFAQRWLPPKWDREPTITATSLPDDYVHYALPRTLTVREWARLQTFPDWYEFWGPRTTGGLRRAGNPQLGVFERELPRYTQIGNAVPVALATEVGRHLARLIEG